MFRNLQGTSNWTDDRHKKRAAKITDWVASGKSTNGAYRFFATLQWKNVIINVDVTTNRRFRNNRFWHNFFKVFMTWSFSLLRKNSIDFFLQLILSRITWQTVLVHVSQRHPRYHRRRFRDTMCEPYKSLKTISGLAKPTSNHFFQFSLNFFNLLQFASSSFFLFPIFSCFLTVFLDLLPSFFFGSCFSFEGIFSTYLPCRSNPRIKGKLQFSPHLSLKI